MKYVVVLIDGDKKNSLLLNFRIVSCAKTRLGAVGGRTFIFSMLTYRTSFCYQVVIIELL